jgi:hypothetical protein
MAFLNKITVNRVDGNFLIDSLSDYNASPFDNIDQGLPSEGIIQAEVDSGTGFVIFYNNLNFGAPNYSVDPSNNDTTNPVPVLLPLDENGNVVKGDYRFTFQEQYTDTPGGNPIVVQTIQMFTYNGQVEVEMCLQSSVNCFTPEIQGSDKTQYDVDNVAPNVSNSKLTLHYPPTSGVADLESLAYPLFLATRNVWTKGYTLEGTLDLSYNFIGYTEVLNVTASHAFEVECDSLCDLYPCIESLRQEMNAEINDQRKAYLTAVYNQTMSLSTQVMAAQSCGQTDDITSLLNQIRNLINTADCTSSCGQVCSKNVSEKVVGSIDDPAVLETAYLGVGGTTPTTGAEILLLTPTLINANQVTLATGDTDTKFKAAFPPGKVIQKVVDLDAQGADITAAYVFTSVIPVTIDGTPYDYNYYEMSVGASYDNSHNHVITLQ